MNDLTAKIVLTVFAFGIIWPAKWVIMYAGRISQRKRAYVMVYGVFYFIYHLRICNFAKLHVN